MNKKKILLGIVHMMIVGLSKLTDDEMDKIHQFDGVPGMIIAILRIGMFLYFLFGLYQTHQNAREKVKSFIYKFGIFGSLFFLSFPIILLISMFIAPYNQHRFITISTLLSQSLAIVFMSKIFTCKQGEYYNASLQSQTILPDYKNE
ncbi:hypothetical protein IMG5_048370 [Ichthyophthirius multifiliis]|uniref:GPR180/TMEM145 transmembrane domain-containing protein n=1 Tax=Ichthyophthirius multifiliis TaxID=5932 RepID=G0QMG0_ICHMU|nr:hypothetical protein IMG5_048370 [Ichthyophthirius multifiliis]EGR33595.1 hypothetical protein IMG5_048370 [Ichthyophthirius multifiliis]|eukprot:XP_004037581.1 hypothetical protein IMG5_048370 [Ichthyophthirius multifiliis]